MENNTELGKLNPWVAIWTKPRKTIQQIVDSNPKRLLIELAMLIGVAQGFNQAVSSSLGDSYDWPMILWVIPPAGALTGLIQLYLASFLLYFTGKWLDGKASIEHVRAVVVWSSIPAVWTLGLLLPEIMLFGDELFKSDTPTIDDSAFLTFLFAAFSFVDLMVALWMILIFCLCLSQVQKYSVWKALLNLLLAGLAATAAVIPLAVILGGIS